MDLGLKNKVVLCMASAAGLGKGIATELARTLNRKRATVPRSLCVT